MQVRDKAVVITGGSQGLGAALGRAFAASGAKVALIARGRAALERVVDDIRAAGGEAHAIAADVGDKSTTYAIAGQAAALIGPADIVVHNASTLGPTPLPLLLDTECEDLAHVLEVNLIGPFRLTKALAGNMLLRGQGLVVHVSSDAAVEAYPGWGAYGVSKAALDHLARVWAAELDEAGVRFLSIDPGEMATAMHQAAIPDADPSSLADPAAVAARILAIVERADRLDNGARVSAAQGAA
jgi:NAD(P)-dependent dehydrogenase (short-subunit alcohol dehydrogenase family)